MIVLKVISGGQTGVDRAALDAAIETGIPRGGFAPKGRKAEDGRIPEKYHMEELTKGGYPARTKKNIEASDGTLVFCQGKPKTGTKLTVELAAELGKPCLVIDIDAVDQSRASRMVYDWIISKRILTMNVAGPRLSSSPSVAAMAKQVLLDVLSK